MSQLRKFLRSAHSQFRQLTHVVIRVLHIERTAQLVSVLVVSCMIGGVVGITVQRTREEKRRWVSHVEVLVTSRAITAGEAITAQNTVRIDIPEAIIADDAIAEIPSSATARISLGATTPLTLSLIATNDARLPLPAGWRGVALPVDLITPTVRVGDTVDVVARDTVIADGALVVQADREMGITLAVPAERAAAVATAAQSGDISIVLAGS